MNQQIKAIGAKTKWYNSHTSPYPQNQMFLNNQEQYFQQLNNDEEVINVKFQTLQKPRYFEVKVGNMVTVVNGKNMLRTWSKKKTRIRLLQ